MNGANKIKYLLLALILCGQFMFVRAQAPSWAWAKDAHTGAAEWANDVAVDPINGDVVVVGVFNSDLSAFYGSNFTGAIGGGFVAKYDSAGNVKWAFPIGNNQDDACNSVTVSLNQNIYVTGYLQNIADFKGMSGVSTIVTSSGGKDIFLAKYNSAGQLQWVRKAGGGGDDEGLAVCNNSNLVFITGYFTGGGTFSGVPTVSNMPNENLFVAGYDAAGNIQWLTDGGSGQSTFGRDITADNNGVYVTGDYMNATLSIYDYMGANVANLANANPTKEDAFVLSISAVGPFNWAKNIHSTGSDFGRGITQNALGIYATGSISSAAIFPGYLLNPVDPLGAGLEVFVAQFSRATGNTNWVNAEQGPADEEGTSITIDTTNAICATGYFKSTLNFGGGPTLTSTGSEDIFVAAYTSGGTYRWSTQAGDGGIDIPHGISTYTSGEIYVAGEYENNAAFGPNVLTADTPQNIFLAKLGCVPVGNNTISAAQTICAGQTPATLNGSVPSGTAPFSYNWLQSTNGVTWSPASGTNNTQNYSPPALVTSTYYRRSVSTTGACASIDTSGKILITVNQPAVANAGVDSSVCTNKIDMYATALSAGTGTWTLVSGGGTIASVNSPTTSVTNMNVGINVFEWSASNSPCSISRDTISITVIGPPTTAAAGSDQTLCASTYTLNGNIPTAGTGLWTIISGTTSITSPTVYNSGVTGMSPGTNVFVWTITNSCGSSADTVNITVDANPTTANAGQNQSICATTFTLAGNNPSVGTGTWTVLSGGGTVSNPSQFNSPVTGLSAGNNNLVWTISNGVCPVSKDTVTIAVSTPPTTANAGANQNICANTYTLNANTPVSGTGVWTVFSGGATVVSPGIPNSAANNLSAGNNIFIWTITNGSCPPSKDSVTINVTQPPTVSNAGSAQNICNDSTFLNGNIPSVGTGSWTVVSGGGTVANASQNNSLAYNLSVGNNIFMWTISNGICPQSTSTVSINVSANPGAAIAGTDQTICSNTVTLNATAPSPGSGAWSVLSGGGSVTTSTLNTSGATSLSLGINTFVWTVTNGSCPANKDTVQITVDQSPSAANAGTDYSLCVSTVTLNASVPAVGTGSWAMVSGGATVVSPSQNNSAVTGLTVGANSFQWVVSNGVCAPSRDTVTIYVDQNPTPANAGFDQTICASTAVMNANNPAVGLGVWTVISGGSTIANATQSNSGVSGLSTGQNLFTWTISNGTCPASVDTLSIQVDAMPAVADAGTSLAVCSPTTNLGAVAPTVGSGSWSVVAGGGMVTAPTNNASGVLGLSTGTNIFQWTVSNGVCPSNNDTMIVFVYAPASTANAGADQTICVPSSTLGASTPASGTGLWSVVAGGGSVASPNSPSSGVSNLSVGQNIFVWTITNGVCPQQQDTVVVNVNAQPSVANAGPDQNVCINPATAVLVAATPTAGIGMWSVVSGSGTLSAPTQVSSGVSGLSLGQNIFVWTISNSACPSNADTVVITVYPNPTTANAGNDTTVAGVANLNGNIPVVGVGAWSVVSGSGSFANSASASTQVTGLSIGDNVFAWTISNGICPASYDEVVVHVNELVVPNGFSPNGDLVNDNFEIPGLDMFSGVKLEVFNRWGNLVYENDEYKNDWGGKNRSGDDLTDDTYYFTLTVAKKVYKGFVVLKRK